MVSARTTFNDDMGWLRGVAYRRDWCAVQVDEQRIDARDVGFLPAGAVRLIDRDEDSCACGVEFHELVGVGVKITVKIKLQHLVIAGVTKGLKSPTLGAPIERRQKSSRLFKVWRHLTRLLLRHPGSSSLQASKYSSMRP